MDHARVLGLQTAVPDICYSQEQMGDFYVKALSEMGSRHGRAVRKILSYAGVGFRHFAVDASFYETRKSTQQRNDVYMAEAVKLGVRADRCRASLCR